MKRGEIWTAPGGAGRQNEKPGADMTAGSLMFGASAPGGADYAGKPRPVVIVQDDRFEATNSVTVCSFTSDPTDARSIRPAVEPDKTNGLNAASRLMIDKITTVPRAKLGRRVGRLGPAEMARLERALTVFLGLAG